MFTTLTRDMRAIIQSAHLCFAATVTPQARPNVSPKGTIRVWDDRSLFFLDIASPGTRANLAANPWMELNVVDQSSRRGYRFSGRAEVHQQGLVEYAAPLVSPGYWNVADEHAMRALWRERRHALDEEFEAHLAQEGPFRITPREAPPR